MMAQTAAQSTSVLVETQRLTRIYDQHIRALDGVSLTIAMGEMVAIMGPSGSGKSTLLHQLGALDRPTSGEVLIGGQNVTHIRDIDRFRARTVGFIFQFHNLIPTLTALENVVVPMRGGTLSGTGQRGRARDLLIRVGLGGLLDRRPAQLSGGQRQRVAVARALANEPALILADEPTGNLDSQNGAAVMNLLREVNVELDTTVLLVTHDPLVALSTDRILTLRDGKVDQDERVEATYTEEMESIRRTPLGRLLFGEQAMSRLGVSK
jgi:ABC-type lipoprotein export system ATPase subunit